MSSREDNIKKKNEGRISGAVTGPAIDQLQEIFMFFKHVVQERGRVASGLTGVEGTGLATAGMSGEQVLLLPSEQLLKSGLASHG